MWRTLTDRLALLDRHSWLLSEIRRHRLLIARSVEVFTQVAQGFRGFRGGHWRVHIMAEKIVVAGGGKAAIGAQVDGGGEYRRMIMEAHASGKSNPVQANGAPRCGARTRTTGQPCRHPARKGSGRRFHGVRPEPSPPWLLDALKAKSTKHGWFSQEAIAARRAQGAVLRALKAATKKDDETMSGGAGVRGSIEGDI